MSAAAAELSPLSDVLGFGIVRLKSHTKKALCGTHLKFPESDAILRYTQVFSFTLVFLFYFFLLGLIVILEERHKHAATAHVRTVSDGHRMNLDLGAD